MKPKASGNFRRISKGTSLIEVMISVLILSVGLLGIAAMQATALRNTQSSMQRTQAVIQSYAVLDAMRANATQARANSYNTATWTCAAPGGATLVNTDMNAWINSLRATVSDDACGRITCATNICTIDVRWDDTRGTGGSATQTIRTVSRI